MSGKPTHAAICHTGNHLTWLAPGERWLNWPKMYAVDQLPYYGLANRGINVRGGAGGVNVFGTESWNAYPGYDRRDSEVPKPQLPLLKEHFPMQWMRDKFSGKSGPCVETQKMAKSDPDETLNVFAGDFSPDLGRGSAIDGGKESTDIGTRHALENATVGTYWDGNRTADPKKDCRDCFNAGQNYQGVDRELRKEVGAQRYVGWYPDNSMNGLCNGGGPPYIYRRALTSKWQPQPGSNEGECMDELKGAGSNKAGINNVAAGLIGGIYYPGYLNWEVGGVSMPTNLTSANRYCSIFDSVASRLAFKPQHDDTFYAPWHKKRKNIVDQMCIFYPIAYAAPRTRKIDKFWSGFEIKGGYDILLHPMAGPDVKDVVKTQKADFRIVQACKSHLQMVDMMEGDERMKTIMPYQGMNSTIMVGLEGWGQLRTPNFKQDYIYHADSEPRYVRKNATYTKNQTDPSKEEPEVGSDNNCETKCPEEGTPVKSPVGLGDTSGTAGVNTYGRHAEWGDSDYLTKNEPWKWDLCKTINPETGEIDWGYDPEVEWSASTSNVWMNERGGDFYPLSQDYLDKMFNTGGSVAEVTTTPPP